MSMGTSSKMATKLRLCYSCGIQPVMGKHSILCDYHSFSIHNLSLAETHALTGKDCSMACLHF